MNQHKDANKLLSEAFDFSEDDIAANREGKLSNSQKSRLVKIYFSSRNFWGAILLGLPFLALGIWVFVTIGSLNIILKIMILLVGLLLILPTLWQYISIRQDINAGQVTSWQGRISLTKQASRGGDSHFIGLNNHRGESTKSYEITAKQYKLLNQHVDFRVNLYITPKSKIIVAMEES